ncbi:exosome nuclease subunit RRP6 NDAI_0D00850 [Naumovozyma dairenensis CBS 421]|uniref:HRDC domain-containing protein n=1 Tax=Naumovozyma dairenensis (strain ATCC 10597 / BCRC 20456 / CBS 421 / NBRC 0211 / NRRL Y-12639) TaxID=1071378 RepID=G0W9D8_NAUDC|nr:hypothetical protein NDAI_0D00850 [Naumovozyma dairenensis CBS 421]CCD24399.1 hypothetical protein NDAI_0D00850 [Naumovozyma dairenensis CBS 421]
MSSSSIDQTGTPPTAAGANEKQSPKDQLLPQVVQTVRASVALAAQDVDFYRSMDKTTAKTLKETTSQLADMINSVLLAVDENSETLDGTKENLEDNWKDFSNLMDNLLEKSDRSMDMLLRSKNTNTNNSNMQYLDEYSGRDDTSSKRRAIGKPQLEFDVPVDNTETHPFIPLLKSKPNALKSLDESIQLLPVDENVPEHYAQPYEYEIDNQPYNDKILQLSDPIPSQPWMETTAIWVDTPESLQSMIKDLNNCTEFAVDLEHHDYRTYYGIVCLMQISTRTQDYIVDTLKLRSHLQPLNEPFTNPQITKVLHGAFMDIIWLQRDLGLYIVSLFDTFHASRALGFPKNSLAYLLEKFSNFKTSKKYQMADWRIRPLSKAMNSYARSDTHFLLNIFDQMRNKLVQDGKLAGVLKESRNVAKRRFEYVKYRPLITSSAVYSPIEKIDPWKTLMYQYNIPLAKELLLKELYQWRDKIARRDDESPRYIMPNQLLVSLVAYAPVEPAGVVSVSNMVTDHVRSNSKILANLIKNCLTKIKDTTDADSLILQQEQNQPGTSTTTTNVDLSEQLSIHQLNTLKSQFLSLYSKVNHIEGVTNNARNAEKKNSFLLCTDHMSFNDEDGKNFIKYSVSPDKKDKITTEELLKREEMFDQAMEQLQQVEYSIPIPENEIVVVESEQQEPSIPAANAEITTAVASRKKEDLDEIIVLKKTNRNKGKKRERKHSDDDDEGEIEVIDYSKMEKVLDNSNTKRNQNKNNNGNKRKRFDPYNVNNEGPRAPKKRKAMTRGKNVSFKR